LKEAEMDHDMKQLSALIAPTTQMGVEPAVIERGKKAAGAAVEDEKQAAAETEKDGQTHPGARVVELEAALAEARSELATAREDAQYHEVR
jgi:hypothetical protein